MDDVQTYQLELQQVQAALALNPTSEDLVKLEQDLKDIIALSSQLDANANANVAPTSAWTVGDICEAIFSQDGVYYRASILELVPGAPTCKVKFIDYGNEDIVQVSSIRALESARTEVNNLTAQAKLTATTGTVKDTRTQAEKDIEREKKKKKQEKRKAKDEERTEIAKESQNSWKKFSAGKRSSKSKGGFAGKKKESIFKSPDSVDGKVGVGTCGIGGKGMTDFVQRDKWTYEAE